MRFFYLHFSLLYLSTFFFFLPRFLLQPSSQQERLDMKVRFLPLRAGDAACPSHSSRAAGAGDQAEAAELMEQKKKAENKKGSGRCPPRESAAAAKRYVNRSPRQLTLPPSFSIYFHIQTTAQHCVPLDGVPEEAGHRR